MALRLLARLAAYYLVVALLIALLLRLFPMLGDYLPVGRVQSLIAPPTAAVASADALHHALLPLQGSALPGSARIGHIDSFWGSIVWLVSAMLGALLTSLPVSWTYMEVRHRQEYDQSLIGTILILPIVITGIVVIVQNSLALSFSLAGIVGAVRFRNTLKSTGDLLFTLLSIAIGISAGIGAVELAAVTSVMFNLCFVALWATEYGERAEMKRFLSDYDPHDEESRHGTTTTVEAAVMAVKTTTVEEGQGGPPKA